jgi:hypothetical protein
MHLIHDEAMSLLNDSPGKASSPLAAELPLASRATAHEKRVEDIVRVLRMSSANIFSCEEARLLFSEFLRIPVEMIPLDHEEVLACVGLSCEEVISRLSMSLEESEVQEYHAHLFPANGNRIQIAETVDLGTNALFSRITGIPMEANPNPNPNPNPLEFRS